MAARRLSPRFAKCACSTVAAVFLAWRICPPIAPPQADSFTSHYERGADLARSGQLKQALEELKRAAELKPRDPRTHNMMGVVFTQLGQLEEAEKAYTQALMVAPDFVPARKNRAVNAFTQRRFPFATSEFQVLARVAPNDFVPHLFLGLLSIESLRFEEAHTHLSRARRLSPKNSKVLIPLTRVEFILGKRAAALESARDLITSVRATEREQFELAATLAQFEANTEAEALFRALKEKQPDSDAVAFNLVLVQYRLGRSQEALRTIQDFGSRKALTGELLNLRGWVYSKMRRFSEARRSLEDAIKAEPDEANHYLDLSTILRNAGDTEAAVRTVLEGIERQIGGQRLRVQLGLLLQKQGDHEGAERSFGQVLSHDPANRSGYLALAHLFASTGRQQEALRLLEKGVRALPADGLLHYMYGGLLLEAGQDDAAEAMLRKALALNPLYANTHYLLGKLFLKRGDDDAARASFERACAFNPEHVGAYYRLSLLARRKGDKVRAQEYSRIVQRLTEQSDREYREGFHQTVDESLQENRRGDPSR